MRAAAASFPERLVDRAAALLAGRNLSRRRFLYRTAVVGSALTLNPLQYLLRPISAYASVCGSGNSCESGWSVFCCTINGGANTCPDGSYVAGWWKVDASAFCLDAPRYYVDCNRLPDASCSCRCNDTGCDHRRSCCNTFRYGQCNTQIGGVTEVVCRIVTCTPPWEWDPACGRTVRTEESTRSHSSACLPGQDPTRIELKYQDLGLVGSVLGRPAGEERDGARGGRVRRYGNGVITWRDGLGAHASHGAAAALYVDSGLEAGPLGYLTSDHEPVGDRVGQQVRFEKGTIYVHPDLGPHEVRGSHDRAYRELGGPRGSLGYPTTGTAVLDGAIGTVTELQGGAIYAGVGGTAFAVTGGILAAFRDAGGPAVLGVPIAPARTLPDGVVLQRFGHGLLVGRGSGPVHAVRGLAAERYLATGGPDGPWGLPAGSTEAAADGTATAFEAGVAYASAGSGAHLLEEPILARYRDEGGPAGPLGFPTSGLVGTIEGRVRAGFEGGAITFEPATGETVLTLRRPARPASDLP